MSEISLPKYSKAEEIMNAVTHGIGIALSIAGLVILVVFAAIYGDAWKVVSSAIYGAHIWCIYDSFIYCLHIVPQLFKNKSSKEIKYV